jgi:hypothetical protein
MNGGRSAIIGLGLVLASTAAAQQYLISTVAGGGSPPAAAAVKYSNSRNVFLLPGWRSVP